MKSFWAEAVNTANLLRNCMYSSESTDKGKTAYEVIIGTIPDFSYIKPFGCKAYFYIPKERRKKQFENQAKVGGIIVAFERGISYKVFFPGERRYQVSRDVRFEEQSRGSGIESQ